MKFGKQIQKKQLEIPEYAASFVDYKALKRLIKALKNSPVTRPDSPSDAAGPSIAPDPQSALQANRETFFFRLDRELDKVNAFYTLKEKESRVRLRVLIDKQRSTRARHPVISRNSTLYLALEQGFRDFIKDLSKLQQFIEVNATAFAKILKKWDKTSKSHTKELYLSRAVEIQPCFNRDVISELSDQANISLLDCAAWAEGESTVFERSSVGEDQILPTPRLEQDETDSDLLDALNRGDALTLRSLINHVQTSINASERLTKAFLSAVSNAPEETLKIMLETNAIDFHRRDEINDRNCLHKAAMTGRKFFLNAGLSNQVDPSLIDAYGRIPLHYACMNGHVDLIQDLIEADANSKDVADLDNATPLIHAIVQGRFECVAKILSYAVRIDPIESTDQSALNLACQHGFVPIVELLLASQPTILPDAEGLYPQHLVARFGRDPRIFLMLRDYGANLDQPDKLYQWTPMFHAASEGRVECLKKLLECGANPTAKDEKGLPAQYYATWEGHLECMALLAAATTRRRAIATSGPLQAQSQRGLASTGEPKSMKSGEIDPIPALLLPPPIIPTRRYGHNFLESKTTVIISFNDEDLKSVMFYDQSKYPAARLTVAPRSSDMLPRNILLPIQEENRSISFEIDSLDSFAVDFDVFPTFGKKVIAKGSVPPEVFQSVDCSSGKHYLSLLDPRLRSVGQIRFTFQVIKPFSGTPLNITPVATYWKATSQFDSRPSSFVTGSSLSGDHIRVYVQLSKDRVPVIVPHWTIHSAHFDFPIQRLDHKSFAQLGESLNVGTDFAPRLRAAIEERNLSKIHGLLLQSYMSLGQLLEELPIDVNVEMHILYPNPEQESRFGIGPTLNLNRFVDALLKVVFQHALDSRNTRGKQSGGSPVMRSMLFSSYNKDLCMALNWKQPNFPVLLCNDLGADYDHACSSNSIASGSSVTSIKEAVRIAQSNNLMGLVCRSQLLDMVPALVHSIKVAGLVLVSDASSPIATSVLTKTDGGVETDGDVARMEVSVPAPTIPSGISTPEGIDGILRDNGVLTFNGSIEI